MISRENIWNACPENRLLVEVEESDVVAPRGDDWEIVGPEKERARLAYAVDGATWCISLPKDADN
jgi:hypothetical protein